MKPAQSKIPNPLQPPVPHYYIALWPDADSKAALAKQAEILRHQIPDKMRWVRPENYHLTLKYLGEATDKQISTLSEDIKKIWEKYPIKEILSQKIHFLPASKPHVLVIAIKLTRELAKLYREIENETFLLGFEKETKIFLPHITLARCKTLTAFEPINYLNRFSLVNIDLRRVLQASIS